MRAAERSKAGGVEALRPERKPRDAQGEPADEARAVERRRVRLERRLTRPQVERAAQGVRERGDLRGLEEARRPAAEVERPHPRPAEAAAFVRDLAGERLEVAAAKGMGRRRRGEVAVGAARRAER